MHALTAVVCCAGIQASKDVYVNVPALGNDVVRKASVWTAVDVRTLEFIVYIISAMD